MIKQMYAFHWQCEARSNGVQYLVSVAACTAHNNRAFVVWAEVDRPDFDDMSRPHQALFLAEVFGALWQGMDAGLTQPLPASEVPCHPAFANRRALS